MALSEEFDAEDLRKWEADPRGAVFWQQIRRMANMRMEGIRSALLNNQVHQAQILSGELNMAEEILQLVDIIIQEENEEKP